MYNRHADLENRIMELSALHSQAVDSGNLDLAEYYTILYSEAVAELDKLESELI
jgi:hypothetical protein